MRSGVPIAPCLLGVSEFADIKVDPIREFEGPPVTCMTAGSSTMGEASWKESEDGIVSSHALSEVPSRLEVAIC